MQSGRIKNNLSFDKTETSVYSDEVLALYAECAQDRVYSGLMAGMPVRQFIDEMGLVDSGYRIYRDVLLEVDVEDEVDIRDETVGHYRFSFDSTDPNWYPKLVQEVNSVLSLKADFDLRYKGKNIADFNGTSILLDEKRNKAILKLGSKESKPLFEDGRANGSIGKRIAKKLENMNHFSGKSSSGYFIGESLTDVVTSPISSIDEEDYANGTKRYFSDRDMNKVFNIAVSKTVEDFVDHMHSTSPKQWASLLQSNGIKHFEDTFMSHLNNEENYGVYSRPNGKSQRFTPVRPNPEMFFNSQSADDEQVRYPFGGQTTSLFGDMMLDPNERKKHHSYPMDESESDKKNKSDKAPIGQRLERAVLDFWRDAGLKNVNSNLDEICQKFVVYLKRCFGKHLKIHGTHIRDKENMVKSFKRYLQIRNDPVKSVKKGEIYYGNKMKNFINERRHPEVADKGVIRVVKHNKYHDKDGRVVVKDQVRMVPYELVDETPRKKSFKKTKEKKRMSEDSSSALTSVGTYSSDEAETDDEDHLFMAKKSTCENCHSAKSYGCGCGRRRRSQEKEMKPPQGPPEEPEGKEVPEDQQEQPQEDDDEDLPDLIPESPTGETDVEEEEEEEEEEELCQKIPKKEKEPLPKMEEEEEKDLPEEKESDEIEDEEQVEEARFVKKNKKNGSIYVSTNDKKKDKNLSKKKKKKSTMFSNTVQNRRSGKPRAKMFLDSAPALVPVEAELFMDDETMEKEEHSNIQQVSVKMPALVPLDLSDSEVQEQENTKERVAFNASMLMDEITDYETVLSYKHRQNAPVEFVSSTSDEEEDNYMSSEDDEQAFSNDDSAEWKSQYTQKELDLLKYMPKLHPISKPMPALEPIESSMPETEELSFDKDAVTEVEARVQNLTLQESSEEKFKNERSNDISQSITESYVATKGMGFAEFMKWQGDRIEKKTAKSELFGDTEQEKDEFAYSKSDKDSDNFRHIFDKYVEYSNQDGDNHLQKGAIVLAPTSDVFSEKMAKAVKKKYNKPDFKRFVEVFIVLPEHDESAPSLQPNTKDGKRKVKTMHGKPISISRDALGKTKLHGEPNPDVLKIEKSKKHRSVYFLHHKNLFR